jgi:hypothetical protein
VLSLTVNVCPQKRKRDDLHEHNVSVQRIRRAKILAHPFVGDGGLKKEIGENASKSTMSSDVRHTMGKAWVQQLRVSTIYKVPEDDPPARIKCFVVDPDTRVIYAGSSTMMTSTVEVLIPF